jgi:hypothetical protein
MHVNSQGPATTLGNVLQADMPWDDTLVFQLYLPQKYVASAALQLKPLAEDGIPNSAAILGIPNFEVTLQLADHSVSLGIEDTDSGGITKVAEGLAGAEICIAQKYRTACAHY